MSKSAVFHKNSFIGEVEIYPKNSNPVMTWPREVRISHFSPPSERSPPLAILHTVAAAGVAFKMESRSPSPDLFSLYSTCLHENKTAVVISGEGELHLVAMPSRKDLIHYSSFWGFIIAPGLYNSCLIMLNLRCLGIVFDLDETLIVANTMRSFEDRISSLQAKLSSETDPQRITGMLAEVKRYQEDKSILKQYLDNDQVIDNGKVFRVQSEVVQPISDGHQQITRPIIRLQEKNVILTRVNPAIRDTSVLVRLRPAWEDLRSYLTARGRKRFEVYVCTMAERDYALEMWRLLDPESNLINSKELLDRIVCVKPGTKKSLLNVFQDGNCHPKMALVIDDRLKVWDEKDQPRVHVVPAFAPYYAPQAEANNTIPVLCVARNVACNVRGSFFKEFDEALLPGMTDVFYEDEIMSFPSAPDVGNYLISEEDTSASNGNKDPLGFDGMADVEVERRLKEPNCSVQAIPPRVNNFEPRPIPSFPHVLPSSSVAVPLAATQVMMPLPNNQCSQSIFSGKTLGQSGFPEPILQCSTTEEGEVPESDLDPNARRRLLILQHGQDLREPPPPPPPQVLPTGVLERPDSPFPENWDMPASAVLGDPGVADQVASLICLPKEKEALQISEDQVLLTGLKAVSVTVLMMDKMEEEMSSLDQQRADYTVLIHDKAQECKEREDQISTLEKEILEKKRLLASKEKTANALRNKVSDRRGMLTQAREKVAQASQTNEAILARQATLQGEIENLRCQISRGKAALREEYLEGPQYAEALREGFVDIMHRYFKAFSRELLEKYPGVDQNFFTSLEGVFYEGVSMPGSSAKAPEAPPSQSPAKSYRPSLVSSYNIP